MEINTRNERAGAEPGETKGALQCSTNVYSVLVRFCFAYVVDLRVYFLQT
jgi:hypothetical protein